MYTASCNKYVFNSERLYTDTATAKKKMCVGSSQQADILRECDCLRKFRCFIYIYLPLQYHIIKYIHSSSLYKQQKPENHTRVPTENSTQLNH